MNNIVGKGEHMSYIILGFGIVVLSFLFLSISKLKGNLMQWVGKGVIHLSIGAFLLYLTNMIGSYFDVTIPFNLVTLVISGILGIPGIITLVIIKVFMI